MPFQDSPHSKGQEQLLSSLTWETPEAEVLGCLSEVDSLPARCLSLTLLSVPSPKTLESSPQFCWLCFPLSSAGVLLRKAASSPSASWSSISKENKATQKPPIFSSTLQTSDLPDSCLVVECPLCTIKQGTLVLRHSSLVSFCWPNQLGMPVLIKYLALWRVPWGRPVCLRVWLSREPQ